VGLGDMKLFVVDSLTRVNERFIYLRSDDDPSYRTEMSGEVSSGGGGGGREDKEHTG